MNNLTMKRVSTAAELDVLRDGWDALATRSGAAVFQSWNWNRRWVSIFLEQGDAGELDVRTIFRGDDLIAILPFFVQNLAGPVGRVVQFLGHRMSYHNDVLTSPDVTASEFDEIVDLLRSSLGSREIVHLRHLHGEGQLTRRLLAGDLATRQIRRVLLQDDPERPEPEDRLGKSSRRSLKNRRNRLTREHGCQFRIRTGEELGPFFDGFLELHHRRFESIGKDSLLGENEATFLRTVIQEGFGEVVFEGLELVSGDRVVAAALLARDGAFYFNLNFGFDPEFDKYSPMVILIAETIRRGFREHGCTFYDLGPGYEKYKLAWGPIEGANYFACFGGRQPSARLLAAAYKKAFEHALPPDAERS